ncbi:MAG: hypothetical protein QXQ16_00875 [Candidatus Aenigmatarchaeota archaeon]
MTFYYRNNQQINDLCKKETKIFLCKYCKRYFCKEHIDPKPVLTFQQVFTAKEPLRSKLEEFWREEEERTIMRKMWEALDRLNEQKYGKKESSSSSIIVRINLVTIISSLFFSLFFHIEKID